MHDKNPMNDTEILDWLQANAHIAKGHASQIGTDDTFVLTSVFDGYPTRSNPPTLREAVMFEVRRQARVPAHG